MVFDKSKVCVAGLHEVKEGTKGWFADDLYTLKDLVEKEISYREGYLQPEGSHGYKREKSQDEWQFFYPTPEPKYRHYKTIEEALTLKGKWLKHKNWDIFFEVTKIEMLNGCALINDINPSFLYKLYTLEDGTPIGIPE